MQKQIAAGSAKIWTLLSDIIFFADIRHSTCRSYLCRLMELICSALEFSKRFIKQHNTVDQLDMLWGAE